jgi:hypothetical protein
MRPPPSLRGRSAATDEAIHGIKNNPYINEIKKVITIYNNTLFIIVEYGLLRRSGSRGSCDLHRLRK